MRFVDVRVGSGAAAPLLRLATVVAISLLALAIEGRQWETEIDAPAFALRP